MASTLNAALCAAAAVLLWTSIGLAVTRRLAPLPLALPLAPVVGWSVHSAVALLIFFLVPFSAIHVAAVAVVVLLVGAAAASAAPADRSAIALPIPAWIYAAAAVLAMAPAVAIVPKHVGDAVILADPIFDHAKVALIDEMTRLGLPPGNPFFGGSGPAPVAYYYLWHFSAAELALLLGVSGWEADIAMTWLSAFASLLLMMGLAVWLGGRVSAAAWVVALAAAGSARHLLVLLVGEDRLEEVLAAPAGFGGWLFQSAWAPQHLMSASCVVLAIWLISRMAVRRSALLVATTVLVVVAGFESSTWIGGIALAASALIAVPVLVIRAEKDQRLPLLAGLAVTALAAAGLAAPFLHDQLVAAAARGGAAALVAIRPFEVMGDDVSDEVRGLLDPPAFWLVLLVLELPAIYLTGSIVLAKLAVSRHLDRPQILAVSAWAALAVACLMISWLVTSTLAENNDLGWRAVLPPVLVLTVLSAVGISGWIARRARFAAAAAVGALVLGLPGGAALVGGNIAGRYQAEGRAFAATPDMWAAVRRHAAVAERVGNNPLFLQTMTLWPANLSWSLLANRRSCYAGRELALVFTSLPQSRREAIDDQFVRVFAGHAEPGDIADLATQYDCRLILLTSADGAWGNDPFATSPLYRVVDEKPGQWRLYRATAAGN
jgi:hypothetical protein